MNEEKTFFPADAESNGEKDEKRFLAAAARFRLISLYVIVALGAFLIGILAFGHRELRAENFKYLVKYVGKSPVLYESFYDGLEYGGGENTTFGLYKGDVCLLDGNLLSLYGISGKTVMTEELPFEHAVVDTDGQYLCAYSRGGNEMRLYNSFSCLISKTFSNPILLVRTNAGGGFAVATSERGYRSVVTVYNEAWEPSFSWKSADKFVFDFSQDQKGRYLGIACSGTENGIPYAEFIFSDTEKGETVVSRKIAGATPLGVRVFSNGSSAFVTESSVFFYDRRGNLRGEYDTGGTVWNLFSDGDSLAVFSSDAAGENFVLTVYDKDGIRYRPFALSGRLKSVRFTEKRMALLFGGHVEVYRHLSDGTAVLTDERKCSDGARDILPFDDGSILVCYGSYTSLLTNIS